MSRTIERELQGEVRRDVVDHVGAQISLHSVVCAANGFPVLAGVDLTVRGGEVVLVSGANGAGKTSLLRLIAGLLPVHTGQAWVLGHDLARDRRTHRTRVALVAQETFCYDDLTVGRNLRLHARAAGVSDADAERAMTLLGLHELRDVAHGRLSTGQRRRCSLAVDLARRAEILLLDEPHAGLDPAARNLVDVAITEARASGTTVVLVSHELGRARDLVDREVRMAGGAVLK